MYFGILEQSFNLKLVSFKRCLNFFSVDVSRVYWNSMKIKTSVDFHGHYTSDSTLVTTCANSLAICVVVRIIIRYKLQRARLIFGIETSLDSTIIYQHDCWSFERSGCCWCCDLLCRSDVRSLDQNLESQSNPIECLYQISNPSSSLCETYLIAAHLIHLSNYSFFVTTFWFSVTLQYLSQRFFLHVIGFRSRSQTLITRFLFPTYKQQKLKSGSDHRTGH